MGNKNALIIGIRNEDSLCTAIAAEIKKAGCSLYATYQDDTTLEGVKRVAQDLGITKLFKYDATLDEDLNAFIDAVKSEDITLDYLVHGISYSTSSRAKLNRPLVSIEWEEFTNAIRTGAFSLVEVSGGLLDILKEDASIITASLYWSTVAVPNFNVVCATKAALESIVRGLAQSMGKAKKIRVNAVSPGFMPTYSISKIGNRLDILERAKNASPLHRNVTQQDVAGLCLSILENRSVTGMVYAIDTGVSTTTTAY